MKQSEVRCRICRWIGLCALAVMVGCGGRVNTGGTGSDTSWLKQCDSDSECRQGSCLCGTCTIACDESSECSEVAQKAECSQAAQLDGCGNEAPAKVCTASASLSVDGESDDSAVSDDSQPQAPSDESGVAPTDKLDLLLVVDNSRSMANKQELLASAVPELLGRLTSPRCVDDQGAVSSSPATAAESCQSGSQREFLPLKDIHAAVITTSLGGYGAPHDCVSDPAKEKSEQAVDRARLLGSLPRGSAATGGQPYLSWQEGEDPQGMVDGLADLVVAAGEFGCGWEAPLESWYRFLVEPFPYTKVVRTNCSDFGDTNSLCIGPETDGGGNRLVDSELLAQRAAFLRSDSVLAVVMLSDENDCSFRASGQSWQLAQALSDDGFAVNSAFKGSAACAMNPNDACCVSCGASPPEGCPVAAEDPTTSQGCEGGKKYDPPTPENPTSDDSINLRCFQQKRRFGVDYLYPVERYANALKLSRLCSSADDLDPAACDAAELVENPLFAGGRPKSRVILGGIVGVPWVDLATEPAAEQLRTRRVDAAQPEQRVNWDWIIGERNPNNGIPNPADPLMRESIAVRTGTNPATGSALASPGADLMANPINGHEWNISHKADLQYACIFPLPEPKECLDLAADLEARQQGRAVPACACTELGTAEFSNPLCQGTEGFGLTQRYAGAYPGLRQLQVLRDVGAGAAVASICAKQTGDPAAGDYGYQPAVDALLDRVGWGLAQ